MRLLRTSIVMRTVAIVMVVACAVGFFVAALTMVITMQHERANQTARLTELLDTVESTASVACFLDDSALAGEVVRGLLKSSAVSRVTLRSTSRLLADEFHAREGGQEAPAAQALRRRIASPFNAAETVGEIILVADEEKIRERVFSYSRFVVAVLVGLTVAIALAVGFAAVRLVTRPIKRVSDQLHVLPYERGETLVVPAGHEHDEIGQLVGDVNGLVGSLVELLHQERQLRTAHEISEQKFRAIFESAETGIFLIDSHGAVLSANRAFWRALRGVDGEPPEPPVSLTRLLGEHGQQVADMIESACRECRMVSDDLGLNAGREQPVRWLHLVLSPVGDDALQGIVNDITARKQAEVMANVEAATERLRRRQASQRLAEAELKVLQAQIEPHFLYNTLANVQYLVRNNAAAAEKMLSNLIRYLRQALPALRAGSSLLGHDLEMIDAYLSIMQVRLGDRFSYQIACPEELRGFRLPPSMVMTLVENAIKHGIEPQSRPCMVLVTAARTDTHVVVTVADTGVGLREVHGSGVGLKNIEVRLAAIYGGTAEVSLRPNEPSGVVAELCLPIQRTWSPYETPPAAARRGAIENMESRSGEP